MIKEIMITQLNECKANTLPILMHQMRISTTKVSSVVLRPKKSWKSENSGKEPYSSIYTNIKLNQCPKKFQNKLVFSSTTKLFSDLSCFVYSKVAD
jgi:hypothetical protein